jgi:cobalt-zinc-cadmium efflux system protein
MHVHAAHDGKSAAARSAGRLAIVFGLTTVFMLVEAVTGYLTNSLALIADAAHMLADASGLGLTLLAIRFARKPASPQMTYGHYRIEVLAALTNGAALLLISGFILYEAWERMWSPPEVRSGPMLVVAAAGLVVNLVGLGLLRGASEKSLTIRGAYLEVLADMLGSVGVIAAGVVVWTTGWYLADPIIAVAIGLLILPRTWALIRQVIHVLMEGTPPSIDLKLVEEAMTEVGSVEAVHDLHIWTITSGLDAMSAHVTIPEGAVGDQVLASLEQMLRERFHVEHTTIQLEVQRCEERGVPV